MYEKPFTADQTMHNLVIKEIEGQKDQRPQPNKIKTTLKYLTLRGLILQHLALSFGYNNSSNNTKLNYLL